MIPKSPPGSHAWCIDCDWIDRTEHCEHNARAHSNSLQHVVHVFEPEG